MLDKIAKYKIISKIGSGGMATVYLATDTHTGKKVALKLLKEEDSDKEKILERFRQEGLLNLDHPHIVKILDAGEHEQMPYIVMDYIEGEDLEAYIKRRGPLDIKTAIHIFTQILSCLSYVHAKGIIHRDIKPKNILIDHSGRAYLMDFGIAKSLYSHIRTSTGGYLGAPTYSSPEQMDGKDLDVRSDIYSLGITFYEMLAGSTPFGSSSISQLIKKKFSGTYRPVSVYRFDIPQKVQTFLSQCMALEPKDRFSSAREAIDFLSDADSMECQNSDTRIISNEKDLKEEVRVLKQEMMHIKKTLELLLQENSRLKKEANPFKKIQTVQDGMLGQSDLLKGEKKNRPALIKTEYFIGDTGPAGGWVFYVSAVEELKGWRCLEAAPRDFQDSNGNELFNFCQKPYQFTGASESMIGSGEKNTKRITDFYGAGNYAAWICRTLQINGYRDWFLASLEELELMRKCLDENGVGCFYPGTYWSSTEVNEIVARAINFKGLLSNLDRNLCGKGCHARVRAIRAFVIKANMFDVCLH